MASLKKLLSDSVVYGLSSIVGRFLNYLLVPVYTYHITAASGGYGVVTNVYAYTALLLVILTFGMETTYFYFANRAGGDERRVYSTALTAVGTVALVFVALVMTFIGPISGVMGYADHPEYLRVMACVVALDAFQAILFARLRQKGKAWHFAGLKLGFIVASLALNLFVFVVAPQWADRAWMGWYNEADNVGYIFYINLLCTALVTLGFVGELRDYRPALFDRGIWCGNDVADVFQTAHYEGGDKHVIRGEYIDLALISEHTADDAAQAALTNAAIALIDNPSEEGEEVLDNASTTE